MSVLWYCTLLIPLLHICLGDPSKIHPKLSQVLAENGNANVIVTFNNGVRSTLDTMTARSFADRGTKNKAFKDALVLNADTTQSGVSQLLSTRSAEFRYFKSFWAGNKIFIREASADIIDQISDDPEVRMIYKEPSISFPVDKYEEDGAEPRADPEIGPPQWNIQIIQAPEAWEETGSKGEGVVVCSIDTGVRHTHESLRDNFVGINYGWFDPNELTPEPFTTLDHGTHVTGIAVGGLGVGVAPGAKWMTCLLCYESFQNCSAEAVLGCFQWVTCPSLPDGTGEDCSKAPHILNNSWGTYEYEGEYDEEILLWKELGMIPIFAIGNQPPRCKTTGGPANQPFVIGVGGSTKEDEHSIVSSVGPAPDGSIKPDLVAPGFLIYSPTVWNDEDDRYSHSTGTSFSVPHVVGVVALLKAIDPDLTYDQAYQLLTETADFIKVNEWQLGQEYYCQDFPADTCPNVFVGHGRVNALKAVQAQTSMLKKKKK